MRSPRRGGCNPPFFASVARATAGSPGTDKRFKQDPRPALSGAGSKIVCPSQDGSERQRQCDADQKRNGNAESG